MNDIYVNFRITEKEFESLRDSFDKLCWWAAHRLKRQNSNNNYTEDLKDVHQELLMSLLEIGSYQKRQIYIEKCFVLVRKYVTDPFLLEIIDELDSLWKNRKRHGANRQKYGTFQEKILEKIVEKAVPLNLRPNKEAPLTIDSKFARYCRVSVLNRQKNIGKKITREKPIRNGQVSLSEFDFAR
jgi:hypothetical protein